MFSYCALFHVKPSRKGTKVNKLILIAAISMLSGCVIEQAPQVNPHGQTTQQPSFHPTLYTSPGTVGGVSHSEYTVTEIKR
jgi:uncharacterized lipoprotein YajG